MGVGSAVIGIVSGFFVVEFLTPPTIPTLSPLPLPTPLVTFRLLNLLMSFAAVVADTGDDGADEGRSSIGIVFTLVNPVPALPAPPLLLHVFDPYIPPLVISV